MPSESTAMAPPSPALEVAVAGAVELAAETRVAETNAWSEPGSASDQPTRQRKASEGTRDKTLSALDAAAKVLSESGQAMTCQDLIGAMAAKGYWSSPKGRTPASTLYAAILHELQTKGTDSRFIKTEPGKFALRSTT